MKFLFSQEVDFPNKLNFNGIEYYLKVEYFKKRSSSLIIKDRTLNLRLSKYLTKSQKIQHFESLIERVRYKLENNVLVGKTITEVLKDKKFIFNEIQFKLIDESKNVKLKDNIFYYNPSKDEKFIEKKIISLLIKRFKLEVQELVYEINSNTYNFPVNSIDLKYVNSKWGHCTSNNDIMINLKLLNAPRYILDYVIIHELAHIKYKNHSQLFWREVEKFCPNYKKIRKELKTSPPSLFI